MGATRPFFFPVPPSRILSSDLRNRCAYVVCRAIRPAMRSRISPSSSKAARAPISSRLMSRTRATLCRILRNCSANSAPVAGVVTEGTDSTSVSSLGGSGDMYTRLRRLLGFACSDARAALEVVLFLGPVDGVVLAADCQECVCVRVVTAGHDIPWSCSCAVRDP
ncbi:hypothetical protein LY76DRAFT_427023 [Colletotrichum caudatum]|nr:hypothetical protein LY76DRAFT_427023 [Colletotrichum caudatum]